MYIGYHEKSSNGYEAMGREALAAGGSTFAFFTRNPRGGPAKPIDKDDALALRTIMKENHFGPIVAHAPYTMNPCSSREDLREYALDMLVEDLVKLESLPGAYYNMHPGCHTGQGEEEGIRLTASVIAEALKRAHAAGATHTTLLIETMAGKGSEIGATFQSIRSILDAVDDALSEPSIGVCLDTCHIWDAGYDIAGERDDVIAEFDKVVGLDRLKAIHLNDSMNERGSRKDRHQKIGEGHIGLNSLRCITQHSALCRLPFILETPNDEAGYKEEINLVINGRQKHLAEKAAH